MRLQEREILNQFALFFLIIFFMSKNHVWVYFTGIFLILSLVFKSVGRIVASGCLMLSNIFRIISTKVLLTLFFFLFLTPLALIRKLFRPNLLWLNKPKKKTYWQTRNKRFRARDLEKVW